MEAIKYVLLGTGLSFFGTVLGSSIVFFYKSLNKKIERCCLGFAAGVMMAASIFSLIIPSMNISTKAGDNALIPVVTGLVLGGLFLLFLDRIIPHLHIGNNKPEGIKTKLEKSFLLVLAVTLHNIPEGMAVGVSFALASKTGDITLASAFALAIGMCLQNIPEGAAVALPVKEAAKNKKESFLLGSMSGIVEPIFGVITVLVVGIVSKLLPYFLSFAAGAMIYVIVEELIPESIDNDGNSNIGVISFMIGFIIMLILDIALG